MHVQFTIKEYSVSLSNFKQPYGWIMLFDEDGSWRARLNFVPLPNVNETTNVTIGGDFIELYMNMKLMDDVIDLLRNEKPLTATANSDNNIFILGTGNEPVGEEETRLFLRYGMIPINP